MKTQFLKPNNKTIELACNLLKQGEVVAVPTETVYGLAGNCTNPEAIKKIFKAKGRPADNPLIVHISNLDMLKKLVKEIPNDALVLAECFWPGPLTMIMKKSNMVCKESCAGLDSVGIRMPAHPLALEIIEKSGIAFSAPSANISGKPSPTNANDVFEDMSGKIPLVLDGGECEAGVESTVLSLITDIPTILRPGVITKEQLEKVLNKPVAVAKGVTEGVNQNEIVLSPGMKYKHYSPNAKVIILKGSFDKFNEYVKTHKSSNSFALCFDDEQQLLDVPAVCYGKQNDPKTQAKKLFSALRELDKKGAEIVFARCPETTGISLAVYNRLIRSAGFNIITL